MKNGHCEDPYAEPKAVTAGEVIGRYQKDGYLDRDLLNRCHVLTLPVGGRTRE
jgi:hypothetical protein